MRIESNPAAVPRPSNPQETQLREAAMDFEALLIAQVLHSFRGETGNGGLSDDSNASSSTMMEFAEQHLSQVMSRQGGLGLHELIVQGLRRNDASTVETQSAGGDAVPAPGVK